MRLVFADTAYFIALVNAVDDAHEVAISYPLKSYERTITTRWILTEFADALCDPETRLETAEFIAELRANPDMLIAADDVALFDLGFIFTATGQRMVVNRLYFICSHA
jgi:hypothetical protein